MAEQDNIGDLVVNVTGDFSELEGAISQAQTVAQDGADVIAGAFVAAADKADWLDSSISSVGQAIRDLGEASGLTGQELETFKASLQADVDLGISLEEALKNVGDSAKYVGDEVAGGATTALEQLQTTQQGVADSAQQAASGMTDESDAAGHVGQTAHEAESGLHGMAEQLLAVGEALVITEGLREFGQEALTAYGIVQSVTIGITQLTGSAKEAGEAIEQIKELASTQPFAFPDIAPTVQKMVALGVSMEQLPAVMQAVANASASTGNGFNQIANSLDRISLSGNAGDRQLVQLGLSVEKLAAVMNVSDEEFKKAFKDLDQSERIDVLTQALGRFAGASEAQAKGIAGQWQIFKNTFEEVMVAVGDDLAPVVSQILAFGKDVLQATEQAAAAFKSLPPEVQEITVAVGLAAAAVIPLTGALAALGFGLAGLQTLFSTVNALMVTAGIAAREDAAGELAAATATAAHGESAVVAAGEVEALATAESGAAIQMGLFGGETVIATTAAQQLSLFAEEAAVSTGFLGTKLGGLVGLAAAAVGGITILTSQYIDLKKDVADSSQALEIFVEWLGKVPGNADDANTSLGHLSGGINDLAGDLSKAGFNWDGLWTAVKAGTGPVGAISEAWKQASKDVNEAVGSITGKYAAMETAALKAAGSVQAAADQTAKSWADMAQAGVANAAAFDGMSKSAQTVLSNVGVLNQNIEKAKQVLDELKQASDGSAQSLEAIKVASHNVEAAQKTLATAMGESTKAEKAEKDSLQDLLEKQASANLAWNNARDTLNYLNDTLAAGVKYIGNWDIAADLIPAATKNMESAFLAATGKLANLNTTALQGEDAIKGWMGGIAGFMGPLQATITQFDSAGHAIAAYVDVGGRFVKITADGETAAGGFSQKMIDVVHSLDDESGAAGTAAGQIQLLTSKTTEATKAWVDGKIAVQDYNGQLQVVDTATQGGVINVGNFTAGIVDLGKAMSSGLGATNDEANAILGVAKAADDASQQVEKLSGKIKGIKGGGSGGTSSDPMDMTGVTMNGESLAGLLLAAKQAPLLSGFVGAYGLGQSGTNEAQGLADATGQIVTTIDGTFIPAVQRAAILADMQAKMLAAANAAQQANTAAVSAATPVIQALADTGISIADNGDTIIHLFSALPTAVQSYLSSVNGTLKSYDETTQTLNYLTSAGEDFTTQLNAATTATGGLATLATAATTATAAVGQFAQAATVVGTIATSIVNAVVASTANLGPADLGPSATLPPIGLPSILPATGKVSDSQAYTPSSYGYTDQSVSSGYPGGVNLTVNVTGNSITSQALVNSLADKVGSVIITNLRTNAGLKL